MKDAFNEILTDKLLNIDTIGRDDKTADDNHSPYEPTSYMVLDRLCEEGMIGPEDFLVDFGCGKGRVPIYMAYKTGCRAVGIDIEERFIEQSQKNLNNSILSDKVSFIKGYAEEYTIEPDANRFYFFNPFSYKIFKKIYANILASYYDFPREIMLYFYYPSSAYISGLMFEDGLEYYDEINCNDIFGNKDNREMIMIFKVI